MRFVLNLSCTPCQICATSVLEHQLVAGCIVCMLLCAVAAVSNTAALASSLVGLGLMDRALYCVVRQQGGVYMLAGGCVLPAMPVECSNPHALYSAVLPLLV